MARSRLSGGKDASLGIPVKLPVRGRLYEAWRATACLVFIYAQSRTRLDHVVVVSAVDFAAVVSGSVTKNEQCIWVPCTDEVDKATAEPEAGPSTLFCQFLPFFVWVMVGTRCTLWRQKNGRMILSKLTCQLYPTHHHAVPVRLQIMFPEHEEHHLYVQCMALKCQQLPSITRAPRM